MAEQHDREKRIRAKAHEIWEQEGRPHGKEHEHWEKARTLVAIEDDRTSLKPIESESVEDADIQKNLGEFPTALTDQGDRQQVPSRAAKRKTAGTKTSAGSEMGGLKAAVKRRRA